jgi:hypothetical protein
MGCLCSKPKIVESLPGPAVVIELRTVDKNPMICKNESLEIEPPTIIVESVSIDIAEKVAETITEPAQIIVQDIVTEMVETTEVTTSPRKSNVPTQIELYKESVGVIDRQVRPSAV